MSSTYHHGFRTVPSRGMPFDEPSLHAKGDKDAKTLCPRCGHGRIVRVGRPVGLCGDCKYVLRLDPYALEKWGEPVDWDKVNWDAIEREHDKAIRAELEELDNTA